MGIPDPMLDRAARAMVETDLLLGANLIPLARGQVTAVASPRTGMTEDSVDPSPPRSVARSKPSESEVTERRSSARRTP